MQVGTCGGMVPSVVFGFLYVHVNVLGRQWLAKESCVVPVVSVVSVELMDAGGRGCLWLPDRACRLLCGSVSTEGCLGVPGYMWALGCLRMIVNLYECRWAPSVTRGACGMPQAPTGTPR